MYHKLYILNDLLPVPEYEEASDEDIIEHPAVGRHLTEVTAKDIARLRALLVRFEGIHEEITDSLLSLDSALGDLADIVDE